MSGDGMSWATKARRPVSYRRLFTESLAIGDSAKSTGDSRLFIEAIAIGDSFYSQGIFTGCLGTTYEYATDFCFQRKCFYGAGLYWIIYAYGDSSYDLVYRTSPYGTAWSAPTIIPIGYAPTDADEFSAWYDGTYLHLTDTHNHQLLYMRGQPKSNGTITWTSSWVVVEDYTSSGGAAYLSKITIDSNGYPWIIYSLYDPANASNRIGITKSSTKDGTWVDDTGFPYYISIEYPFYYEDWQGDLAPLTNGKIYAIWGMYDFYPADNPVRGSLWNGSSWGAEEDPCTVDTQGNMYTTLQIIPDGDDVHMVRTAIWISPARTFLIYNKRDHSSSTWSTDLILSTFIGGMGNNITGVPLINVSTGTIYVFFANSSDNTIYYTRCISGTWDASPTAWIAAANLCWWDLTAYPYRDMNGEMGVLYQTGKPYTYCVRFNKLTPV